MNTVRASSLPRVMACPASLQEPDVAINKSGEVAAIGTAVHEVMADIIGRHLETVPDLASYARKHGVEEDAIEFLCWRGLEIWKRFKPLLEPDSIGVERELATRLTKEWQLTGHLDAAGELNHGDEVILVVIDWKSGYVERNYNDQLAGYALLSNQAINGHRLAKGIPAYSGFKIVTAWLRSGAWDVLDLTPADVEAFKERLVGVLASPENAYSPDDGLCMYCPRSSECPARAQIIRSAIQTMLPVSESGAAGLTQREKLASVFAQSQILARALDEYREAVKASIRDEGDLPLPDGRFLTIKCAARDTIQFGPECVEVLAPYLGIGSGDIAGAIDEIGRHSVTVNKGALLDAVAGHAPYGSKAGAKRDAMAALLDSGCVTTTTYDTLAAVKNIQSDEEKEM